MDSKSILLSCLFVLFWFAASAAATGDKVTLQVEFKSDNEIVYVCDPDGGTNTERCEFYLDNKTTDIMSSKDGNTLRLNVTLTTETEAVVTCRCNFSSGRTIISDQVAVATSQRDDEYVNQTVRPGTVNLTCPLHLGRLSDELDTYYICWLNKSCETLGPECCLDPSSAMLSFDNRTWTVDVHNSAVFQCTVVLDRCLNLLLPRYCGTRQHGKATLNVDLFFIRSSTGNMNVTNGTESVTFSCEAHGRNLTSHWIVNGEKMDESDVVSTSRNESILRTNIILTELRDERTYIMCVFDNPHNMSRNKSMLLTVEPSTYTTEMNVFSTPPSSPLSSSSPSITPVVASSVAIVVALLAVLLIVIAFCCCYIRKKPTKQYSLETPPLDPPPRRRKRSPIYEELPCGPIFGTEPQLMRQIGIDHDPTLPRHEVGSYNGSDEPLCGSSDVSGLSGVSNNIPGAHKMPSFTSDDPAMSDRFLHPPLPWTTKNVSNSTFNTTATHSTVVSFTELDNCHDGHAFNSKVHYPRTTVSLNRRCNSQGVVNSEPIEHQRSASFSYGVQPGQCLTCQQHLPFSNAPIAPPSKVSSSSSVRRNSSASSSTNNSLYHQSPNVSPYHQSFSPYHQHDSTCDSLHRHPDNPQPIRPDLVRYVMDHVQHNKNCQIPGCCCKSLRNLSVVDVEHKHGGSMRKKASSVLTSSSTESESDTPDHKTKKRSMHLELKKEPEEALYPHNHLTTKSHAIRSKSRKSSSSKKRRSRSLADLTPITEMRETPTPVVGGPVVAGTPIYPPKSLGENGQIDERLHIPTKLDLLQPTTKPLLTKPMPQLLKQKSISIDNVPALCLNDCVAKLTTPSPTKHSIYLTNRVGPSSGNSELKAVPEIGNSESDGSNTSSRSRSPTEHEAGKSSQSDTEDVLCRHGRKSSTGHHESLGYESGDTASLRRLSSYNRFESSGYESAGGCSTLESRARKPGISSKKISMRLQDSSDVPESSNLNPIESIPCNPNQRLGQYEKSPQTSRSSSPFETETQQTNNGGVILTTEC